MKHSPRNFDCGSSRYEYFHLLMTAFTSWLVLPLGKRPSKGSMAPRSDPCETKQGQVNVLRTVFSYDYALEDDFL